MFEGSKTNPLIVDRTYFPEKVVRSCDGVFFTKYVPIRTLTLSNGVTFQLSQPNRQELSLVIFEVQDKFGELYRSAPVGNPTTESTSTGC